MEELDNIDKKQTHQDTGRNVLSTYGEYTPTSFSEKLQASSNVLDYQIGINAVAQTFGEEAAKHIESELAAIDAINQNTISSLSERGELSEDARKLVATLDYYGVDAGNFTLDEARSILDYAENKTDEIRDAKTHRIYDALTYHINSVRSRHDGMEPAYYNEREALRKAAIQKKYAAWDKGEYPTERGFDVDDAYKTLLDDGYSDPSGILRQRLEEDDYEELSEDGLVDERCRFVYGPFTASDLEDAMIYKRKTWTDATNWRYLGKSNDSTGRSLAAILNTAISGGETDIEADLIHDYVANEILQSRRLKTRELAMISVATALDVLEIKDAEGEKAEKSLEAMRQSVSFISYYLGKIFGYTKEELKDRFGSSRPLSKDFLDEIATEVQNLSDSREAYLEKSFKPYLTKLDEHLRNIMNVRATMDGQSSIMDQTSEEFD